ncbi:MULTISPECIES: Ig-like domain-containing protein [Halorussus]|uniref:Ig-like domain-containing protein n=1 Tax=Halorussus TaxID=1070314 RepID=UPI000E2158C5|nr:MULTISPECIES: Ig-like domain-containing protein [Halorussus]NHN59538.1 hypothetical protein [Halorussus sp. JP-T4]
MRLRTDDRGVTVQVGTVLLFAVVVVLLSTYQASVVPQQNEQVEFDHNQRVQGQLQDLRDELLRTAVTGSGGSSSVALGTRYPVRAVFVNPAPPSGTLATTPAANATIRNATADGETGDYWTGHSRNFSTLGLTYDPLYHVYQNPPTTVFRNGVLYNRYPDANRTLSGQRLVRGNRISLVALNGSLSESASGSATVDFRAVSAATRTVTVRNETANLSVVVPTTLAEGKAVGLWRQLLADEWSESPGDDRRVLAVEAGPRPDVADVRIVLEPGTYELQLAKVGVGSDVTGVDPHYVTDVRGDNASALEGGKQQLVVEVRDRFNNPVSGTIVNASDVTDGTVTPQRTRTNAAGRATFVYDASGAAGTEAVTFNISDDPEPREEATLRVHVSSAGTGNGTTGGDGDDGAYWTWWENATIDSRPGMTCHANDTCRYDLAYGDTVTLTANTTPTADGATVQFAVNDTATAQFAADQGTTGSDGSVEADLQALDTENVTVYAASGGTGDRLAIQIYDSGAEPTGTIVYNDDGTATRGDRQGGQKSGLTFSVTNNEAESVTLTDVRVEPEDGSIDELSDSSADEGMYQSELHVDAQRDGTSDIAGGTALPRTFDIDSDGQEPHANEWYGDVTWTLQQEPIIAGDGGTATFYLYEFFSDGNPVSMTSERVTITLRFENHDPVTFTVRGNDG